MKKTILFTSLFILCTTLFAQGKYYVRIMGKSDLIDVAMELEKIALNDGKNG